MNIVKQLDIKKYVNGFMDEIIDKVIVEQALNIYINNKYYITLMCTPFEEKELIVGFLFSEGIISSVNQLKDIEKKSEDTIFVNIDSDEPIIFENKRALTSGCGRGSIHVNMLNNKNIDIIRSKIKFDVKEILLHMQEFNTNSYLFKETGCVHGCCICGYEGLVLSTEDIGRHNALDKLIGKSYINDIDLSNKILLTTGRVSSDILLKAAKAKLPILVSHSAPTDFAIKLAKLINMTLIGFTRGKRMNIYNGEERLIF